MASSVASRPVLPRNHSRVPGGFDTDDEFSPVKGAFDRSESDHEGLHDSSARHEVEQNGGTPPQQRELDIRSPGEGEGSSTLDEKEMRRHLMDVESSFLPEKSPVASKDRSGADDTFVFGSSHSEHHRSEEHDPSQVSKSPDTPPEYYQTPAPGNDRDLPEHQRAGTEYGDQANTSSLETMSSSPTAAAAARTISRVVSLASMTGYETADEQRPTTLGLEEAHQANNDESTPKNIYLPSKMSSRPGSPTPTRPNFDLVSEDATNGDIDDGKSTSLQNPRKRPKHLNNRYASQRSSYSSYTSRTTTSTEGASELTVGAEYALQTGGAAPFGSSSVERPRNELARSLSLGSMASGISALSDGEDRSRFIGTVQDGLGSLAEEEISPLADKMSRSRIDELSVPLTPRALSRSSHTTTTESTAGQHQQGSSYDRQSNASPDRRNGLPTPATSRAKNLTLKEQGSTIDKLQKENWDLKMKIHYLDKALDVRSEEGVKAMISENVELKTQKLNAARELRNQKRLVRELESRLKETQERASAQLREAMENAHATSRDGESKAELESEVIFLRERVETHEVEIEKLRHEGAAKEAEKRQLAQAVRSMTERRSTGSDIGIREEMVCSTCPTCIIGLTQSTRICGKIFSRLRLHVESKLTKTIRKCARSFGG